MHESQCITTTKTGTVNNRSLTLNYLGSGNSPCLPFGSIFGPCLSIFYMDNVHLIFTWIIFVMFTSLEIFNLMANNSSLSGSVMGLFIYIYISKSFIYFGESIPSPLRFAKTIGTFPHIWNRPLTSPKVSFFIQPFHQSLELLAAWP